MITYLDPRGEPSVPLTPYTVSWPERTPDEPRRIGLFANGFPDSVVFLGHIQEALERLLPVGSSFVLRNKGNASAIASAAQLSEFLGDGATGSPARVDGVVAAYGH